MGGPLEVLPVPIRSLLARVEHSPWFEPFAFVIRVGWLFYRELQQDKAFMRAAGMAYATLMALVPLLVLIFGILGTTGLLEEKESQEAVYDALFGTFFGDVAEIREALTPFLSNIDFRALGVASTVVLLVVAGRLFLMVERAYSDIFQVRVDRRFGRRILNFYFAITALPVVMVLSVEGAWQFGALQRPVVSLLQFVLILGALKFFPCTTVRWGPALMGSATSWVLLGLGGRGSSLYIHWSYADPDYGLRAFYGSLILVPIFLLWLYMIWLILLLGVEVAHVAQNYGSLLDAEMEARERERGLRAASLANAYELLVRVADRFERGEGITSTADLKAETGLSHWDITAIAEAFVEADVLVVTEDGWTMARPGDQIQLEAIATIWRDRTRVGQRMGPIADELETLVVPGTLSDGVRRWLRSP